MEESERNTLLAQAQAAQGQGDVRGAMDTLRGILDTDPDDSEARHQLAQVLRGAGDRNAAVEEMTRAIEGRGDIASWHFELGQMLESCQRLEDAHEAMLQAARLDPSEATYPGRLAMLRRRLRNDEGARAAAATALELDPAQPQALVAMAQDALKRDELEESAGYAGRVIEGDGPAQLRATGWHIIGRVRERREMWDEAFKAHMQANRLKRESPMGQRAMRLPVVPFEPYLEVGRELYQAWGNSPVDDGIPTPVVLTGFARSGTTMSEQILGAHPGLATCDELPLMVPVRRELEAMSRAGGPASSLGGALDRLTDEQVRHLRRLYRDGLEDEIGARAEGRTLIDKHAMRTLDLGLLNRIFPDAKIIFMVRDPRDVCLSALFQDFVMNPAVARFLSLDRTTQFYERVMGFWLKFRDMITMPVLEIRYEDLVTDFDGYTKKMLEFVGVEWDEGVRSFNKGAKDRVVRTASWEAVTEGVHGRAIGRWKRYRTGLEPGLARLEPFVKAFGYEPSEGGA